MGTADERETPTESGDGGNEAIEETRRTIRSNLQQSGPDRKFFFFNSKFGSPHLSILIRGNPFLAAYRLQNPLQLWQQKKLGKST